MFKLTLPQLRALHLAAQGLLHAPKPEPSKADVLECIRRMAVLQIDTISVVARSPYFVLWSRLGMYDPRWLDELLAEGAIFEAWSHVACFLPREDFGLSRCQMQGENARILGYAEDWIAKNQATVDLVMERVRHAGPVRSADFERSDGRKGTWWDWKAEKRALEMLFFSGELLIARRHNFQRLYDLRERIRPDWNDADRPSRTEMYRAFALKTLRALGAAPASRVADYYRTPKRDTVQTVRDLVKDGSLLTVQVEGLSEPFYTPSDQREQLEAAAADALVPTYTTMLSPFDPVVWDRARAREWFNFDYQIECYTPAPKRIYGYFTLPILHRGALIGRIDAKAHRSERRFEIKALHLEPDVAVTETMARDLWAMLQACAAWHRCPEVSITYCNAPILEAAFAAISSR